MLGRETLTGISKDKEFMTAFLSNSKQFVSLGNCLRKYTIAKKKDTWCRTSDDSLISIQTTKDQLLGVSKNCSTFD